MRKLLVALLLFGLGIGGAVIVARPADARIADTTITGGVAAGAPSASLLSLSVTTVPAGEYTFEITDSAPTHDFDLVNPSGQSVENTGSNDPGMEGTVDWTVDLTPGTWTYKCDFHSVMHKTFTVTGGTTSTSTTATTSTAQTTTTAPSTTTQTTTSPTTATTPTTTTAPATGTTPTTTGAGLHVRIVSVHATPKLVVAKVAANQLTRATATLFYKGKRLARTAADGMHVTLRLKPAHSLRRGSYLVRVTVVCCGTSATAKKTVKVS